jgi:hypothetical protein
MHVILPKVAEITILYKQQLRKSTILSGALFRNAQYNVMLRFMVQALQDLPLCSNTGHKIIFCYPLNGYILKTNFANFYKTMLFKIKASSI